MPYIADLPQQYDQPYQQQEVREVHRVQRINLNEPITIDENGNITQEPSRMNPDPETRYIVPKPIHQQARKIHKQKPVEVDMDDEFFEEDDD